MLVRPFAWASIAAPEADVPSLFFPNGALQVSPQEVEAQNLTAEIGAEPLPAAAPEMIVAPPLGKGVRKWSIAMVASCLLHAGAAMALLTASGLFAAPSEEQQLEGVDQPGMTLVGNSNDNLSMAGDVTNVTLVVEAAPETPVQAQPAPTEEAPKPTEPAIEVHPANAAPTPAPQPVPERVEIEPVQPEQPAPMVAASPVPEILSVTPQLLDDVEDAVQKAVQADALEAVQKAEAEQKPIEKVMPAPALVPALAPAPKDVKPVPTRKPAEEKKPIAKHKPVKTAVTQQKPQEKPTARKKKTSAGSGGDNQADAKRGAADGVADGREQIASKGGAKSGNGNAAVANYPGKIAAKLRRVSRGLSRAARGTARNNAQVAFVVDSGGGVDALRLVKSSGSPELDKTALAIIRRAAPFPPIPSEAQRTSWAFTLPIGPF